MRDKTTQNAKNLRKNMTAAEKKLWSKLRNRQLNGYKFRRQHPFPPYILDFFCEELSLVIECDGGQHDEHMDKTRSDFLENKGLRILRYWNNEILSNIDGVLRDIIEKIDTPSPIPSPQGEGSKRICVAKIATAHGVRGLVKLHVFAENESLVNGALFTSENGSETLNVTLKNATAKHWLAEIEGITDRNASESLRGTKLYIDRAALPDTDDDEFYYEDLIGLPAIDEQGCEIGKIIAVENFGASDLLEIKPPSAPSFYLPVTDETVMTITSHNVIICIPEGLLE